MKEINTGKFYYGFPIFLIAYKDKRYGYNFTTMSSSYSIDDIVNCGMGKDGGAYNQIKEYKNFSINIISPNNKKLMGYGAVPGKDKFKLNNVGYKIDEQYDVPIIEGCSVCLICTLSETFIPKELPEVINISAKINKRLISEEYLVNGEVDFKRMHTINYYADDFNKDIREV